jgi:hypothetical protein
MRISKFVCPIQRTDAHLVRGHSIPNLSTRAEQVQYKTIVRDICLEISGPYLQKERKKVPQAVYMASVVSLLIVVIFLGKAPSKSE